MLILKIFSIAVVVLVAGLLALAATKPATFRVQRAISIKAPPEKVFALIDDFHSWRDWSPYDKLDPLMTGTHGGAASGKGAVYEWEGNNEGNNKVGKGRMEITDTSLPSKVRIKLDFVKPMEGHNIAEFTIEAEGDSTNVTWAMHGPSPYIAKVMSIFLSMDSIVGKEFENSLANLKTVAER
jgi:uncharacterized protein YndB with AHSA1/START domain